MPVTKCQQTTADDGKCGQSPVRRVKQDDGTRPYYCHECESRTDSVRTVADRVAAGSAAAAASRTDRALSRIADRVGAAVAAASVADAERLAMPYVTADMLADWRSASVRRYGMTEAADHAADRAADAWPRRVAMTAVEYAAAAAAAAAAVTAGLASPLPGTDAAAYGMADAVRDAVERTGVRHAAAVRRQSPGSIPGMIAGGRVRHRQHDGRGASGGPPVTDGSVRSR